MKYISHFFNLNKLYKLIEPIDLSTVDGRSKERKRRIKLTALSSATLKILSMAVPLLTLGMTYSYLNPEVYGLWSAVTTFFALFAFSDLGLGNGLQTKLSQAQGRDDLELCNKIISNTFFILLAITLLLLLIFLSIFWFCDWAALMNSQNSETMVIAASVVFVIVVPKLLSIPVAIIQRTQLALQEGYRSDMWGIVGYVINLISIIIIVKFEFGKLTLLAFTSFLPFVVSAVNMFVYFNFQRKELKIKYKLFNFQMSKSLLSLGIFFSILSILTTIGISMDTFIVAKTCNLKEAGSFSIIYKVATIFSAIVTILSAPLWGANGEALARGDVDWVKSNTKKTSMIMGMTSIAIVIVFLSLNKFIFNLWLGEEFEFSFGTLFWLSIMQVLLAFISPYFMILNALGEIKIQILLFALYTPITIALKYYLSLIYGITVIPMIGSITYLFFIVIWVYYFANKKINKYKFESTLT